MPMYEFRCRKCGQRFEKLCRMQDDDREVECPSCRSKEAERLVSSFAAKGSCTPTGGGGFV